MAGIVVGVDGSPAAQRALDLGMCGVPLRVLAVQPIPQTLGRLLLGSVSTAMVHHADCPVVVIRPRRERRRRISRRSPP